MQNIKTVCFVKILKKRSGKCNTILTLLWPDGSLTKLSCDPNPFESMQFCNASMRVWSKYAQIALSSFYLAFKALLPAP